MPCWHASRYNAGQRHHVLRPRFRADARVRRAISTPDRELRRGAVADTGLRKRMLTPRPRSCGAKTSRANEGILPCSAGRSAAGMAAQAGGAQADRGGSCADSTAVTQHVKNGGGDGRL